MKEVSLQEHCKELAKRYGSYRAAGKALSMDYSYLWGLASGRQAVPSDKILKKLGLRAETEVRYFPVCPKKHLRVG